MRKDVAFDLTQKLLDFSLDVEALIVGVEGHGAHIFHMDSSGFVTRHDDVGFASIGIGAPHSNSVFMAASYGNQTLYYPTFALTYAAKRRAEIAPGVGKLTDMTVITSDGVFLVEQERIELLRIAYEDLMTRQQEMARTVVNEWSKQDADFKTTKQGS